MSKGQWETLKDRIEVDVVDAKFHKLRRAFLKARQELEDYINSRED